MARDRLFTPGPITVPSEVLLELARPVFHHRTPRFRALYAGVKEKLAKLFRSSGEIVIITGSGTAGMEAAVTSAVAAGERLLVVNGGKFGERFGDIGRAHGLDVVEIQVPWGEAVAAEDIEATLAAEKNIGAVCVTLSETSTGVVTDVKAVGEVVARTKAALIVDGISGVGALPIDCDKWGVDFLVVGSQKALMLPPGLAVVAVSAKGKAKVAGAAPRGFYLELGAYLKKGADDDTPFTPAHTLILAMDKALDMILEEGPDAVYARTAKLARGFRAGAEALGLELFARAPADNLTALRVPEGMDSGDLVKRLKERFDVTVANGQAQLKGKIIRVAHMGQVDEMDLAGVLAAIEMCLADLGAAAEPGAGVKAAEEVWAAEGAK